MRLTYAVILALLGTIAGCVSGSRIDWKTTQMFGPPAETTTKDVAVAHYIAAMAFERQGDADHAAVELEEAVKLDPEAITPTMRLIRQELRRQDYARALETCKRAVELAPKQPNLYILLGQIQQQLRHYDAAEAALHKALEMAPQNLLAFGALVELQETTNDLVSAIDIYRKLIEMNPNVPAFHYQLGLSLVRIKDRDNARKSLEHALELNPELDRARYILGVLCMESGDNAAAVAQLEQYLQQRKGDSDAMEHLAGAYARLGRYDDAVLQLATIVGSDQVKPRHHIELMYVLLRAGRPANAEKLAPPSGAPCFSTFFTALARQDRKEPYRPVLDSFDGVEGDLDEECNENLNGLLYLFGEEPAAAWLLQRVAPLRKESESQSLGIIQGRVYLQLKRYADAAAAFEPLFKGTNRDKWVHYYLANCYQELNCFKDAETQLEACLAANPGLPLRGEQRKTRSRRGTAKQGAEVEAG
jgi:tetratricopeptide (TPR) repeat protein